MDSGYKRQVRETEAIHSETKYRNSYPPHEDLMELSTYTAPKNDLKLDEIIIENKEKKTNQIEDHKNSYTTESTFVDNEAEESVITESSVSRSPKKCKWGVEIGLALILLILIVLIFCTYVLLTNLEEVRKINDNSLFLQTKINKIESKTNLLISDFAKIDLRTTQYGESLEYKTKVLHDELSDLLEHTSKHTTVLTSIQDKVFELNNSWLTKISTNVFAFSNRLSIIESNIYSTEKERKELANLFQHSFTATLLFSTRIHGFSGYSWRRNVNEFENTLTLIIANGQKAFAFTDQAWKYTSSDSYSGTTGSFIGKYVESHDTTYRCYSKTHAIKTFLQH